MSSQLRHVLTIGKKNLLNSNVFCRCPHNMANFAPLTAEIGLEVFWHPSKFQRVLRLGFVTAPTSLTGGQSNFTQCLAISWAGTPIHIFVGSCPWQNFATCEIHFASKSCVLYWQRYCMPLQQQAQPNFAAWYKEWNCGTFAEGTTTYIWHGGHHVGHRPTF